jgi:hypothetical protein
MLRLTFQHDDGCEAASQWAARLREATPSDVHVVAAFTNETALDVYVEIDEDTNANAAINRMAATLGLGRCHVSVVVPLPVEAAPPHAPAVPARQLTSVHRGQIVAVSVSADGRELSVRVRHRRYEIVDRLETAESENLIRLTVWVGIDADDPRGDYATLADAFTSIVAKLGQPVGTRRITYES